MTRTPDTRIHYASAGAVRRPRPADPARPTGIQLNYANLLDNLAQVGAPHLIGLRASGADIGERAEHLRKVLGAVTSYVKAVVADTRRSERAEGRVSSTGFGGAGAIVSWLVGGSTTTSGPPRARLMRRMAAPNSPAMP